MAKFNDIIVEKKGKIAIVKFNRPKQLNAFGGNLIVETVQAFRELNNDPDTVFTVLTGEGRFFSAGADVRAVSSAAGRPQAAQSDAEKKVSMLQRFVGNIELIRTMIDHKKIIVLALNGPAVGGGAAWFQGLSDIFLAAQGAWLQVTFSALGLVPEFGSAVSFFQSVGAHRANEMLMFGRKVQVEELMEWGLVNHIFPKDGFQDSVIKYLEEQLAINDGKSMMEAKRLQNEPLRDSRLLALMNAADALAERFVEGAPTRRFEAKVKELEEKSKGRSKL